MAGIPPEKLRAILEAAAAAPSGDNSQPWRFEVRGSAIDFFYRPELDNELLNFERSGTLIALGAAIENARLESLSQGFLPRVTYHAEGERVATLELSSGGEPSAQEAALRRSILKRHTNRKAYAVAPLSDAMREALRDAVRGSESGVGIALIEERERMERAARALTVMEETALSNRPLHALFFGSIFWSAARNRAGEPGLHIDTLELPPPAKALFAILRYWPVARLLSLAGFPTLVAETNAKQDASASALVVLYGSTLDRSAYLETGRALERAWLGAAANGYSVQIVTGLLFLARSLDIPAVARLFGNADRSRIGGAYEAIKQLVPAGTTPILVFRIGKSAPPTEVSYRKVPESSVDGRAQASAVPTERRAQLDAVAAKLGMLSYGLPDQQYAVEQNILFFESLRSPLRYLTWLYGARKRIRREHLLEINELLPELDEIFHEKMSEIERRPRPGIIEPVVGYLTESAARVPGGTRLRIASLGSGSMEAERQFIERLGAHDAHCPVTIVGFDISSGARAYAERNLRNLPGVRFIHVSGLTKEALLDYEREAGDSILVIAADNDIFTLPTAFPPHFFDIAMTVLFLHHLPEGERARLVAEMRDFASRTLNYDGYRNEIVLPLLSLTGWHSPVFLNAAVFSSVRFNSRAEAAALHPDAVINFYNHGHYRATFPI
ncbi:nitroreductase family protein [Patescibacteria group bacterium]|nr:nitroreductase family protein [Patescibacteria group bacterium]